MSLKMPLKTPLSFRLQGKSPVRPFTTYARGSRFHFLLQCLSLLLFASFLMGTALPVALAASNQGFSGPRSKGFLNFGYLPNPFSFIVATDSHFGSSQGNKNGVLALKSMKQYFSDSAFMVHMGDITETGRPEQYNIFLQEGSGLPFPIMPTMGNHESRWEDPQGSLFQKHFGPSTYSFDYGTWHFVVLDSTAPHETVGTIDPSIWTWLDKDLASQPCGKPVAVFTHHPLLYEPSRFQDSDDSFLKILSKYRVEAVFSGHGHSFIHWKAQGREFMMVGALMDGAYARVHVEGGNMNITKVKAFQSEDGAIKLNEEPWITITSSGTALPQNPVKDLQAAYDDGTLSYEFTLHEKAAVAAQIDGGYYNELGEMNPGVKKLALDVSKHARGLHTLRLKVATANGPFYSVTEFGKDTEGLFAWQRSLESAPLGNMLSTGDGRLIIGTRNGDIYCLSGRDGEIIWKYAAEAPWGGGVLDQKSARLFFGTAKGEIHCVDVTEGEFIWKRTLDAGGFSAPPEILDSSTGKSLFIGSSSGKMYALDVLTAQVKWVKEVGGAIASGPSLGAGLVFFGSWDTKFYALNAMTGEEVWSKSLGRQTYYSPVSQPLVFGSTVFVPTPCDTHGDGSYLYALNAITGQELYKASSWPSFMEPSLPKRSQNTPNKTSRYILAPDYSGRITAIEPVSGQILWHLQGSSTLFGGISNLDSFLVTGGSRGILNILNHTLVMDIKVSDTFLLIEPEIQRSENADGSVKHFVIQGDTKGRITSVALPQ